MKRFLAIFCSILMMLTSISVLADNPEITEISEAGTAEIGIGAEVPSNWKVTLPAKVTLVKQANNTYKGTFEKVVSGDIASDKKLIIQAASNNIILSDEGGGKTSKTGTLTDKKTTFKYNEISDVSQNCTISCSGLSAGKWIGTIQYNIDIKDTAIYIDFLGKTYKTNEGEKFSSFLDSIAVEKTEMYYWDNDNSDSGFHNVVYQSYDYWQANYYLFSPDKTALDPSISSYYSDTYNAPEGKKVTIYKFLNEEDEFVEFALDDSNRLFSFNKTQIDQEYANENNFQIGHYNANYVVDVAFPTKFKDDTDIYYIPTSSMHFYQYRHTKNGQGWISAYFNGSIPGSENNITFY